MVVAARALHGQPEEGPREGIDPVRQGLGLGLGLGFRVASVGFVVRSDGEETRAVESERFVDQVPGNLLLDELVVGQIPVEGAYHPVPVAPGSRQRAVVSKTSEAVAVAGRIKPVSRPALAVMRGFEQRMDQVIESIGSLVREELIHLRWGGGETRQVEVDPSKEEPGRGFSERFQPLRFELRQDEVVDRVAYQLLVLHLGSGGFFHRAERPVFHSQLLPVSLADILLLPGGGLLPGPRRAHADPFLQVGDDPVGQFFIGRHLKLVVEVDDGSDQETLFRLAGHHHGAGFSPLEKPFPAVEIELRLQLLRPGAVAFVAMLGEDRANFLFEEGELFGGGFLGLEGRRSHRGNENTDANENVPGRVFHGPPFAFNKALHIV